MMQVSAPTRLPLRRDRSSRFRTLYPESRPETPSWRVLAAAAASLVALAVLAYVARRLLSGDGTLEDAAEDVSEAAKDQAERRETAG
jgi:hypothetical protein